MSKPGGNYTLVIAMGILTGAAWYFGFSKVYYIIYQVLGSPEQPTDLLWAALLLQSLLMGALPGILVPILSNWPSQKNAFVFISAIVTFIVPVTLLLNGFKGILDLISSYGIWAFIFGAYAGCAVSSHAKNAT